MSNRKTAQHTTPNAEPAKSDSMKYAAEEYFSLKDFRQYPASPKFKSELARKMINWAEKDDSRVMLNFYNSEMIYETTFHRWMETSEDLRSAHAYTKQRIAGRLLDGGLTKNYSETLVKFSLPLYSESIKQLEEWRAKIGERVDGATNINVHMASFPDTDVKRRVPTTPIEDKG